ncbi:sinapyl alcohol dehydrogenase [Aureococcus anophagefferens]|nr:sinapyl alcohol dehydrogenase [Aureococcus anophagefferens]
MDSQDDASQAGGSQLGDDGSQLGDDGSQLGDDGSQLGDDGSQLGEVLGRVGAQELHKTAVELAPLGHNGVEVKVTHCAICGSGVHLLEAAAADFGAWPKKQVCGHEIVGKVTGVGAGVGHLAVGQRVGVGWQRRLRDCE